MKSIKKFDGFAIFLTNFWLNSQDFKLVNWIRTRFNRFRCDNLDFNDKFGSKMIISQFDHDLSWNSNVSRLNCLSLLTKLDSINGNLIKKYNLAIPNFTDIWFKSTWCYLVWNVTPYKNILLYPIQQCFPIFQRSWIT